MAKKEKKKDGKKGKKEKRVTKSIIKWVPLLKGKNLKKIEKAISDRRHEETVNKAVKAEVVPGHQNSPANPDVNISTQSV